MSQYRLRITNQALADMDAIYEYIAEILQVPDTALKQYNRIADGRIVKSRMLVLDSDPHHPHLLSSKPLVFLAQPALISWLVPAATSILRSFSFSELRKIHFTQYGLQITQ